MNEIIRIENLTHTYGEGTPFRRSAVENLSLDIYHGEFLGLIGHTGSGKSTLIQHLNGLLKPTGGRVLLDGEDIWADPKKIRSVRFRVGLVFQYPEYQLFEETVYKDISFGPKNMGLDEGEVDRRVLEHQPHLEPGLTSALGIRPDVLPLEEHLAGGGLEQAVEMLDQGGLARAGVADDAQVFPGVGGEVHFQQRPPLEGGAGAVNVGELFGLQNCFHPLCSILFQ